MTTVKQHRSLQNKPAFRFEVCRPERFVRSVLVLPALARRPQAHRLCENV